MEINAKYYGKWSLININVLNNIKKKHDGQTSQMFLLHETRHIITVRDTELKKDLNSTCIPVILLFFFFYIYIKLINEGIRCPEKSTENLYVWFPSNQSRGSLRLGKTWAVNLLTIRSCHPWVCTGRHGHQLWKVLLIKSLSGVQQKPSEDLTEQQNHRFSGLVKQKEDMMCCLLQHS